MMLHKKILYTQFVLSLLLISLPAQAMDQKEDDGKSSHRSPALPTKQKMKHVADTWRHFKGHEIEVNEHNYTNTKIWLEQDGYYISDYY